MDFYRSLSRQRWMYVGMYAYGIFLVALALVCSYFRLGALPPILCICGLWGIVDARHELRDCFQRFCKNRILDQAQLLYRKKLTRGVLVPKFRHFIWARDLQALEERFFAATDKYRSEMRQLQQTLVTLQQTQDHAKHEIELIDLVQPFEAEYPDLFKPFWSQYCRARRKSTRKQLVDELLRAIRARKSADPLQGPAFKRFELYLGELRQQIAKAGGLTIPEVNSIIAQINQTHDLGEMNDLMKRAIDLQRLLVREIQDVGGQVAEESEAPTTDEIGTAITDQFSITLASVAEQLDIKGLVAADVDDMMVRQIVIALLDLGRDVKLFGTNYRPESTLKRRVVKQYEIRLRQQFEPRSFAGTLRWLVQQRIVLTKQKSNEFVYSLASKPKHAATETSAEIIRRVVQFKNQSR